MSTIKGYKVFNPDWTCRGFQYKVGETFTYNGNIELCGKGFHFCRKAIDCFNYYSFDSNNKVAEVEAGGLVETQGNKSVTNKIKIVREIEWQELLTIVNVGKNCTGLGNTNDQNTGDWNTGTRNEGAWNTGHCNRGNLNTGKYNTGNVNAGSKNKGTCNTGSYNIGNHNAGDCNIGDFNTGGWNSINYSAGFFNNKQQPIYMFNRLVEIPLENIHNLRGLKILRENFENSWWIYSEDMTEIEKFAHPEHETTGGYLKTVGFKTACGLMWKKLDNKERAAVIALPNFDADVFKDITGIDINA